MIRDGYRQKFCIAIYHDIYSQYRDILGRSIFLISLFIFSTAWVSKLTNSTSIHLNVYFAEKIRKQIKTTKKKIM
jgi:hypothetical protein